MPPSSNNPFSRSAHAKKAAPHKKHKPAKKPPPAMSPPPTIPPVYPVKFRSAFLDGAVAEVDLDTGNPTGCAGELSPSSAYPQVGMIVNIFTDDIFSETLGETRGASTLFAMTDNCIAQYTPSSATNSFQYMATSSAITTSLAADASIEANAWGAALQGSASYSTMTQGSSNNEVCG